VSAVVFAKSVSESKRFGQFILTLIVLNAVLMGLETYPTFQSQAPELLKILHLVFQFIFVFEISIRVIAHGKHVQRFFKDGWNVFDFVVVLVSILPIGGPLTVVVRLARILRVARVVSVSPDLRLIVTTMLKSIPSMGHVITLTGLLIYIYAILGFYKFGHIDSAHWGTLGRAAMTLFQMLTLEGWVEIQAAVLAEQPWAWTFFYSYIVLAVFIVVNLFIAVVINNLEVAKSEEAPKSSGVNSPWVRIKSIRAEIDQLERELKSQQNR
jgi:voltage-gated sodium channel